MQKESKELSELSTEIEKVTKNLNGDSCIDAIKNAFEQIGFTYVGNGAYRRVYGNDDFVIKYEQIPRQNPIEIENYAQIPKKLRKYFLKPIAYDKKHRWILFPRVLNYDDLGEDNAYEILHELNAILRNNHFYVSDLHDENVGLHNGEMVILDYGCYVNRR